MSSQLSALCFDAADPPRLARFWASVLGWEIAGDPPEGSLIEPTDDTGFPIRFRSTRERKTGLNQLHFHLTSTSLDDQDQVVAKARSLGARPLDVGQRPEDGHVVLADPEGNEFCVIEPGNKFLAGCGFLAELACDGSAETGRFWSAALGWPLVWDQDQETAIRSPHGGPKISWGGPPLMPKTGKGRQHFDLLPSAGSDQGAGDQAAEASRLAALGATRSDIGQGEVGWMVMADPDGHEFCLRLP